MSDWQVGDLALCVDACTPARNRAFPPIGTLLAAGGAYRISSVHRSCLGIDGIEPWRFEPFRFRKITPDKHEACEEEFTVLLKRSTRKVGA